ncbi:MAG: serine/threonine protein kinase [Candidatus Brocadiae bacterium]|nr:serine/threonine protein kinase [Candidatus Brocadiia bacterium]
MAQIKNVLFGKLAVSTRFITEEQLQECLDFQKELEERGERPPRLGEILEQKGYLTKQQIQSILETMSSMQRRRFGEIAVAFHFITLEQLETCLDVQKLLQAPQETVPLFGQALIAYRSFLKQVLAGGPHPRIGDVLVQMGYMRGHQVEAVVEEQNKRIVRCKSCEASLNISKFEEGQKIKCGQCSAVLSIVRLEGSEDLDVALPSEPPPESGTGEEQPLDPKTALFELNKALEERRATQELQKPKMPGRIADFQVVTRLGQDSTGVIFKATQISKNRPVALKIMNPSVMNDGNFQKKFVEDAKKVASIDHLNIKKVYALGKSENRFYIAMEFVEAESVYNLLEKQGKFHFDTAVGIAIAVAEGLQYANGQGLIHGDVRPSNVLILKDGTVKIANLGLATKITENILAISRSGQMAPFYIAPECVTGDREMDARTDIYSLGATLFHMVAGRPPFQGQSPFEVLVRLTEETIPPLKFFDPTIPDAVCRVVERMLEAEPQDRYQSWEDLLSDLRAIQTAGALAGTGAAPGASEGPLLAPPGAHAPMPTAEEAKAQYEKRAARAAQLRSVRQGAVVVGGFLLLAVGGLWLRSYFQTQARVDKWAELKPRFGSARALAGQSDVSLRLQKFGEFISEHGGTLEAAEAESEIRLINQMVEVAMAAEVDTLKADVGRMCQDSRFGDALKRLEALTWRQPTDPEIQSLKGPIAEAAAADLKVLEGLIEAKCVEGKFGECRYSIEERFRMRSYPGDDERRPAFDRLVKEREDAWRVAQAAAREKELIAESEKIWSELEGNVRRMMASFDFETAGPTMDVAKQKLHPEHFALWQSMRDRVIWGLELKQESINEILNLAAQSRPPAMDKRYASKLTNGVEGRANTANSSGVTFREEKSGTEETIAWRELDHKLWHQIIRGGLTRRSVPKLYIAAGEGCLMRADGADTAMKFWLMGQARAALKTAAELGMAKEAAPFTVVVDAYFLEMKQSTIARASGALQAGRHGEVRTILRGLKNQYPEAELVEVRADLEKMLGESMSGGAAGQYWDFSAEPADLTKTSGWTVAGGVLTGNGREETLEFPKAREVLLMFRVESQEFELNLEFGTAKLQIAPATGSNGLFQLDIRKEDGVALNNRVQLKDRLPRLLTLRQWHILEMRQTGTGEARAVEVWCDGVNITQGSTPLLGDMTSLKIQLSGKTRTASASMDIDALFVR